MSAGASPSAHRTRQKSKANRIAATDPLTQGALSGTLNRDFLAGVAITSVNINGGDEIEFDSFGTPYDQTSTALTAAGTIGFTTGSAVRIEPVTGYSSIE